jgi:hypothetical protein
MPDGVGRYIWEWTLAYIKEKWVKLTTHTTHTMNNNIWENRMKSKELRKTIMKEFNQRYVILGKTMWPGEIRFPYGVSHLPLTAARDMQAALEKLPFVLHGLIPGIISRLTKIKCGYDLCNFPRWW